MDRLDARQAGRVRSTSQTVGSTASTQAQATAHAAQSLLSSPRARPLRARYVHTDHVPMAPNCMRLPHAHLLVSPCSPRPSACPPDGRSSLLSCTVRQPHDVVPEVRAFKAAGQKGLTRTTKSRQQRRSRRRQRSPVVHSLQVMHGGPYIGIAREGRIQRPHTGPCCLGAWGNLVPSRIAGASMQALIRH